MDFFIYDQRGFMQGINETWLVTKRLIEQKIFFINRKINVKPCIASSGIRKIETDSSLVKVAN